MTSMTSVHLNSVGFLPRTQTAVSTSTNGLNADRHPAMSDNLVFPVDFIPPLLVSVMALTMMMLIVTLLCHSANAETFPE